MKYFAIMDKNVHYTEQERMLLAQLISEEKVSENKETDATDLKDKADAWERITKKICQRRLHASLHQAIEEMLG